jgi:hypothetical protein
VRGKPLIDFELPPELPTLPLFVIRVPLWMWRFRHYVARRQKLNYAGIAPCETVILKKERQLVFRICLEVLWPTSLLVTSGGNGELELFITCDNKRLEGQSLSG